MDTVKYVGTATRRLISEKDWQAAGVTDQDTVLWDGANGWTVDAGKLSQDARDAIKPDPFFVFSDRDDDSEGRVVEEVEIDLDVAAEYEAIAKSNSTSADGTGLDEPAPKAQKKRGE